MEDEIYKMEDEIYPFIVWYNLVGPNLEFFDQRDQDYPRVCYVPAKNEEEAEKIFNQDLRPEIFEREKSLHIKEVSKAISVNKLEIDGYKILTIPLEQLVESK
jgi:hypothetical protein